MRCSMSDRARLQIHVVEVVQRYSVLKRVASAHGREARAGMRTGFPALAGYTRRGGRWRNQTAA